MFKHQGIWLPDGEKHFPEWMTRNGEIVNGRGTYQIKKFREAMRWCRNFRTAIDVGAHVGLWAMHIAGQFKNVEAFEPVALFRECFGRNLESTDYPCSLTLHPFALGAVEGEVFMDVNLADTGNTHVVMSTNGAKTVDAEMRTLDSFCFVGVDFIKIDCEGFEHEVLTGGIETILGNKPCVIVEQKQHKMAANYGTKGTPAVDFLRDLGAVVRKEMGGDYILSWPDGV